MRNAELRLQKLFALAISFWLSCASLPAAEQTPEWKSSRDAGIDAYNKQDYKTAIDKLQSASKGCEAADANSLDLAMCLVWLGFVYQAAGRYSDAEPAFKRSLEIREKKLGPEHLEVANVLNNLAALYEDRGRYSEAEPLYMRSLEINEKQLGPDNPGVAVSLNNLAALYCDQGRYGEAEKFYKRALQIKEKKLGPDHIGVATSLNNLASLYESQGRYTQAEPLFKRALAIREKNLEPDHTDVASSLGNLAGLYENTARYAEAEPLCKRALAIKEKKLGSDHPDVATALNNLAGLYNDQARYAEAEPLYARALAIREKAFGPEHPVVSDSLNDLAFLYCNQGHYSDAEPLYKRALAIKEKLLAPNHPDVATALHNLASLYYHQGRYVEAESLFKRSLKIREEKLGRDHPLVCSDLNNLATIYKEQGLYAQAEPLFKQALETREKKLGPNHPDVATSLTNLAGLYVRQGRYAEAEPLYERALAIRESKLGKDHPDVATSLNDLAGLYENLGRYADAEPLYKRAVEIQEKRLGPDHPELATMLCNLAILYCDEGRYADAEPLYSRALAIREKKLGADHGDVANSLNNLAALYVDEGRYADAEPLYKRALAIREKTFGSDHPSVGTSLNNLAILYKNEGRYKEAQPLIERALQISEKKLGPDNPEVATGLGNLASLYQDEGKYAEAEPLYKRALDICERHHGPDHPNTCLALRNLAGLYVCQARYARAEPLYKRALEISKKDFGPDNPSFATSVICLAALYRDVGRYAEAEPLYKKSLDIYEKKLGSDHPWVATNLDDLAGLYRLQGRCVEAKPLCERALAIRKAKLGLQHPDTATSLNDLAVLYCDLERFKEAEALYKQALAIREKVFSPENPRIAYALSNLAGFYFHEGRYSEAEPLFKRSFELKGKSLGAEHPDTIYTLNQVAGCLVAEGRYAEAEPLLLRSFQDYERTRGNPFVARGFVMKALALKKEFGLSTENRSEIPRILAALKNKEKTCGPTSPEAGEEKLKLALRILSIGGIAGNLAQDAFVTLTPFADCVTADGGTSRQNEGATGQSAAIERCLVGPLRDRQNAMRKVSSMMLCLAYLLSDAAEEEKANHSANLCLRTLRKIAQEHATVIDIEQLLSVAEYFEKQGQYAYCKDALNLAQSGASQIKNNALLCRSLLAFARVDIAEGDYASAATTASRSWHMSEQEGKKQAYSAQALGILADCSQALGDTQQAIEYARKSLTMRESAGSGTKVDSLPTLLTLGELYLLQNKYELAKTQMDRALAIVQPLESNADRSAKAAVYSANGDLEMAQGKLEEARLWYNKARDINQHADGKLIALARNLNSIVKIDALKGDLDSATWNCLWAARILSDYADASFVQLSFAEQCSFIDSLSDQTNLLLSICNRADSLPQTYHYISKWKGLLIESLRRRTALQSASASNPDVRRLVEQLSAAHRELKVLCDQRAANIEAQQKRDGDLADLTNKSESLERQISQKSAVAQVGDPIARVGTSALRKLLAGDEAIVDISSYHNPLQNKDVYAAIILTQGSAPVFVSLQDAKPINDAIADWRSSVLVHGRTKRDIGLADESGVSLEQEIPPEEGARKQLIKLLWTPIAEELNRQPQIRKVWLCPDSDAAIIPWNIFEEGIQTRICTIDSPRELVSIKTTNAEKEKSPTLLIAAGITFGEKRLDLPGTRVELSSIKDVADQAKIPVTPFTGATATESAISKAMPAETYIHFATHGFYSGARAPDVASLKQTTQARGELSYSINARNPLLSSGLLLSGGMSGSGATGEGKLTADDIVGMDLRKCNLVTLSACETGLGKKMTGQGVIGLRSAILGAGARSILMSLWKVDDEATCRLMTEFYTNLFERRLSPSESLRQAQSAVRKTSKWEHPFYWAGWVLAGDGWQ